MTTPAPKPVNTIHATWRGKSEFDAGRATAPPTHVDGKAQAGQSPPDLLLNALATCSGLDVLDYLVKRRTPADTFAVDVVGERRATHPRRFMTIECTFQMTGAGIERAQAERAVALSFEKYCTVAASLAPDIVVHATVVLNGEHGERLRQTLGP